MSELEGQQPEQEILELREQLKIKRQYLDKEDPGAVSSVSKLAWLLATCPADDVRDGPKAVGNAMRACELTHWENTNYIGSLAAAYISKR